MKKTKQISIDTNSVRERSPGENEKLRQNQEERESGIKNKYRRFEQNASGLNEREGKDEIEDLYKEEESRGRVEAT